MIDVSDIKFTNKNFTESYDYFIKKDEKKINLFWLGTQDYNPILNLQKEIHRKILKEKSNDVILIVI